ncbi:MAG: hypothetical protein KIH63_000690 [Candidatus Saccharibacteria bacterium]|nr:hypothetical protein [Candidatus Saccharibacteria bacterium]
MTASNHVVTGALIVTIVHNPVLGLTLALLSHPFLDMVPHFGVEPTRMMAFLPGFLADVAIALSVLIALIIVRPDQYILLIAGGIAAASTDLLNIPEFIDALRHRPHHKGPIRRFLSWIQWSQTVPGLIVEFVWFFSVGSLLLGRLS